MNLALTFSKLTTGSWPPGRNVTMETVLLRSSPLSKEPIGSSVKTEFYRGKVSLPLNLTGEMNTPCRPSDETNRSVGHNLCC